MTAALPGSRDTAARLKEIVIANVVLPLDGSEGSRMVVPVARGLAQLYAATLHLVWVGEESLDPRLALSRLGVPTEETRGVVVHSLRGTAAEMIVRAAQDLPRSLIVMCTHTRLGHRTDCFGSITESVLASNPERIVLLDPGRGDRPWSLQRVLLAHDGAPRCEAATAAAADLARRANVEVIALHVAASKVGCPKETGGFPAPQYVDQPQHEWPAWASEFMDRLLAAGVAASSMHFKIVLTAGQPGSEVAHIARGREADLVVLAGSSHWETGKHAATRAIIQTSGCPVLLVR